MKKKIAKSLAVLMCLMTTVAFMPISASADDISDPVAGSNQQGATEENAPQTDPAGGSDSDPAGSQQGSGTTVQGANAPEVTAKEVTPADPVSITITVNNKGILASAKDNSAMVNKAVTVTDRDSDGHLTYDEALLATHDTYYQGGADAGYETSTSSYGTSVTKLWGESTYNTLFFTNGKAISTGVAADEVKEGDNLYASVNADNVNYADWYTYFNKKTRTVDKNEEFTLNLKGFQGMAGGTAKNAIGVKIGIWKAGAFEQDGTKVTDADGNVELSFNTAGTYIVTANGTVNDTWEDWSGKTITADCPIMAPVCVVTVEDTGSTIYITVSDKGKVAKDKTGQAMNNRKVSVIDTDHDGKVSCDEALVAAHEEYFEDGTDGYITSSSGWVTELWGVSEAPCLFFINNEAISTSVKDDFVEDGDKLYASILKDGKYYSDYYGFFDVENKSVDVDETFTLTLKAKPGMMPGADISVADAIIGKTNDSGDFEQIQHKETDSTGKVKLSFSKAGKYYVTAKDSVIKDIVATDYTLMDLTNGDDPGVYGTIDFQTLESQVAYTDADYGNGPYPADEVKYVDFWDWNDAKGDYNALHSNELIVDASVTAPVCVVTVGGEQNAMIAFLQRTIAQFKALAINPEVKANATNTKEVKISWGSKIYADGFELSTDNGDTWNTVTGKEKTFTNLIPGTVYKYQVRGYTYAGDDRTERFYSSITDASVTTPLAGTAINYLKSKSKRLTVRWNAVEGAQGYQVWAGTNSAVTKGVVKYNTKSLTQVTKKLKKKKNYYVKVRAYKGSVYSVWSAAKKIKCK